MTSGCVQTATVHLRRGRRRAGLRTVRVLLRFWRLRAERQRQRAALLCLSPDLLRDIGLTRQDALREASKPFWR